MQPSGATRVGPVMRICDRCNGRTRNKDDDNRLAGVVEFSLRSIGT